jgi:hypothetical protein
MHVQFVYDFWGSKLRDLASYGAESHWEHWLESGMYQSTVATPQRTQLQELHQRDDRGDTCCYISVRHRNDWGDSWRLGVLSDSCNNGRVHPRNQPLTEKIIQKHWHNFRLVRREQVLPSILWIIEMGMQPGTSINWGQWLATLCNSWRCWEVKKGGWINI